MSLQERWPQKEGPKAWACTFRAQYEDSAQVINIKMCNLITLTIREATAATLLINTPSVEENFCECLPPPYYFLIYSISQMAITRLMDLGVCSSPDITCFFIPYTQPLPNNICTLEKFTYTDCEESNITIANLVKQTIHMHPNISHFIHRHIPTPNAEVAIRVFNSIHVSSLDIAITCTITHTVWNILINSLPDLSLKDYFEWTNLIHNLQFKSEDYGTGLV
jgi:hypothetical protein